MSGRIVPIQGERSVPGVGLIDRLARLFNPRYTYAGPYHPTINRWTGKPHEHKREIARRLRQQGRLAGRSPGSHMG